jgi:hypothetical protein
MRILLPPGLETPEWLACRKLHDVVIARAMVRPQFDRAGLLPEEFPGAIRLVLLERPDLDARRAQGYELDVAPDGIEVVGRSPAGLLHGIQTLIQLVADHGAAGIPCQHIADEPDFAHRGFYYDISRGKVAKLDTYKRLVDELAALKANMFQLYVEHAFAFRFDSDIPHGPDALTPEEVIELQAYCRDRRIDLVPSLQCFGHMGGVLSLPQYRHLADVELSKTWDQMTWIERMKGATIDTGNPQARALLERMLDTFVPLFDSPFVNVCADETYDLGKGKTAELAARMGKGRLYLDHIRFLRDTCARYGKRMMFWGDIIKGYPDLVGEIPPDTILLNWGYDAETDYESCALFERAGLEFFGCPGTSGWGRLLNALDNADLNIRRYAAAAHRHGATGLLNTDWGDYGHYNLLAGSMHGLALGAVMGWNVAGPDREEFDRRWSARTLHDPRARVVQSLRALSFAADREVTWVQLHVPLADRERLANLDPARATRLADAAREAQAVLQSHLDHEHGELEFVLELIHAVRMNELLGEKALLAHELDREDGTDRGALVERLRAFARRIERMIPEYERLWLARNKRTDLDRILDALHAVVADARAHAARIEEES